MSLRCRYQSSGLSVTAYGSGLRKGPEGPPGGFAAVEGFLATSPRPSYPGTARSLAGVDSRLANPDRSTRTANASRASAVGSGLREASMSKKKPKTGGKKASIRRPPLSKTPPVKTDGGADPPSSDYASRLQRIADELEHEFAKLADGEARRFERSKARHGERDGFLKADSALDRDRFKAIGRGRDAVGRVLWEAKACCDLPADSKLLHLIEAYPPRLELLDIGACFADIYDAVFSHWKPDGVPSDFKGDPRLYAPGVPPCPKGEDSMRELGHWYAETFRYLARRLFPTVSPEESDDSSKHTDSRKAPLRRPPLDPDQEGRIPSNRGDALRTAKRAGLLELFDTARTGLFEKLGKPPTDVQVFNYLVEEEALDRSEVSAAKKMIGRIRKELGTPRRRTGIANSESRSVVRADRI
jgi:hypothetical protein